MTRGPFGLRVGDRVAYPESNRQYRIEAFRESRAGNTKVKLAGERKLILAGRLRRV